MAKNTFQYKTTISVNRENFIDKVVRQSELKKNDLRVCMHLLTHLDSITFKDVSKKNIAYDLEMTKKEVDKSIDKLVMFGIIERGSSGSVDNGYRLLF